MIRAFLSTGILRGIPVSFFAAAALAGCDRITPLPNVPTEFAAPAPGRDELYVSGRARLSMSAFEGLRAEYADLSATDAAELALSIPWLAERGASGESPRLTTETIKDAARCLRPLFSPAVSAAAFRDAEDKLRASFGLDSVDALRKAWRDWTRGRVVEWNRPLAKDYGIDLAALARNSG